MFLLLWLSLISFAELTVGINPKIVGGYEIPITEAPYQVSLRLIANDNTRFGSGFFCGGSLITSSVVLTAAHCMYASSDLPIDPSLLQVVGGHVNVFIKDSSTFVSSLSSFKIHELYVHGESFDHDIAVLKIKRNIVPSSTVNIISLPTDTYPVGSLCLISGWGKISSNGSMSNLLLGSYIPVNSVSQCNLPQYLNGSVRSGMLCAGSFAGGINVCQGDSGGALNCNNTVYGITSHGIDCALPRYPAIFTDVFYYREWILQNKSQAKYISYKIIFSAVLLILGGVIV